MKKSTKRIAVIIPAAIIAGVLLIVCFYFFGYYPLCLSAAHKIERLNLPEDSTVYGETIAYVSDVYWVELRAEKIIVVEEGEEYAEQYIKEHNSLLNLKNIDIGYFTGMTDICSYDFDMLPNEEIQRILEDGSDKYVRIVYEKPMLWSPTAWYYYDDVTL